MYLVSHEHGAGGQWQLDASLSLAVPECQMRGRRRNGKSLRGVSSQDSHFSDGKTGSGSGRSGGRINDSGANSPLSPSQSNPGTFVGRGGVCPRDAFWIELENMAQEEL